MRRSAIAILAVTATAVPALSQGGDIFRLTTAYQAQPKPDLVDGRFITLGGIFGDLRLGCTQCHGMDGAGNSSGAFPRLTDQSAWYLYKSLRDYAAGLRPNEIMGPIARQLGEQQMQNVAAYYASVERAPRYAAPPVDLPTAQIGGAIAAIGVPERQVPACSNCHAAAATAGNPVYPTLNGQYAPYLQHQLRLWKAGRRDGDPMNIMETIAKRMTDEQIRAVSLYYASVPPLSHTGTDRSALPDFEAPQPTTGATPPYLTPPEAANRPNRTTIELDDGLSNTQ